MAVNMLVAMTYFAILLGLGIIIVDLTKKIRIPDAFFMLLIGLILGPTFLGLVSIEKMGDIPNFLRTLALIIIVFASSFHLKMSTFKRVSSISLKLAFGGFFFTTTIMAIVAYYVFGISIIGSVILASICGGTSSASIITFRPTLKEEDAMDILLVEAIFTDPLTVLFPVLLLNFLVAETFTSTMFLTKFWQMIAAGVGTGVVVGYGAGNLFRKMEKELSPILGFSIALIAYALSSNVGGSGILAVAIAALILGNMEIPHKEMISGFEDSLSEMLTISVFTLLGAQILIKDVGTILLKEIVFIATIIFVVRPIYVFISLINEKVTFNEKMLIAFTGPRGAAAAAVAALPLTYSLLNNLPSFINEAQLILTTTFLVIIFTILSSTISGILISKAKIKIEKTKEEFEKEAIKEVLQNTN